MGYNVLNTNQFFARFSAENMKLKRCATYLELMHTGNFTRGSLYLRAKHNSIQTSALTPPIGKIPDQQEKRRRYSGQDPDCVVYCGHYSGHITFSSAAASAVGWNAKLCGWWKMSS